MIISNGDRVVSDPGDVHFEDFFPLIKRFFEVGHRKWLDDQSKKSRWSFLNEMADERDEEGRLSDAAPIYLGLNNYFTLQLQIKASLHAPPWWSPQ